MKIRTKLLLALSPLLILLITLIVLGRVQINKYNDINNNLETNYNLSVLATSIQRDVKGEAIHLRNLLIYEDGELVQREIRTIEEQSIRVAENIARLGTHATTEEHMQIMSQINNNNTEFNDYKKQLIEYVLTGNRTAAIALMNDNSADIQTRFQDLISELTTSFETNMYTSLEAEKAGFTKNVLIESIVSTLITILIFILLFRTIWSFTSRLDRTANVMSGIANGRLDLTTEVEVKGKDEFDAVATSFNHMTASLQEQMKKQKDLTWTKSNIAEITTSLTGARSVESLAETFLSKIVPLVGGSHAVFYVVDDEEDELFRLRASYAFRERKHMTTMFRAGEGLIGQCALEKTPITLSKVPSDYITVKSGLGEAAPLTLYLLPILFEGEVKGIVEIASFESFNEKEQTLLEELINDLGIILESIIGRIKQAKLLEETQILMEEIQTQSEELQTQQDELKATNEELEQQTMTLRESEQRLQQQQEELEETNTELEEKSTGLEKQNKLFEEKNAQLEMARSELEEQARQLAQSSKYKSEFLANMSHELRTPLNSMLILSNLLADNKDDTLTEKQVEFAKTIHTSGKDLLGLINDILDLSKIESGKSIVKASHVSLYELAETIERSFRPVANEKQLGFHIVLHDDLPSSIYTDDAKLQQIVKNLLANAFKFTEQGEVRLEVSNVSTNDKQSFIQFTVKDTGIGIVKEKLDLIFEAFQQVDGTISRRYGGTGLGLSISKEIALLLGGKITVESEERTGSTFSLLISDYQENMNEKLEEAIKEVAVTDESVQPKFKDKSILIEPTIEKQSIVENSHILKLLIVEDDLTQRNSMMELLGDMDVIMKAVSTGKEALDELRRNKFDCLILDLGLTDITGFDLLKKIKDEYDHLKVFIYTGRDITNEEEHYLTKYADIIIIKDQHSPHRLKEELGLYVSTRRTDRDNVMPEDIVKELDNQILEGKKVLLVDDDIRNVYALSSTLEQYGMEISFAENGREALQILRDDPGFHLIITDIMMPEMDGYEAMKQIRQMPTYEHHPIIALTAKAMTGDREKSLQAGASDYIMKPVDTVQLLSLIKVWLFRHDGEPSWNE